MILYWTVGTIVSDVVNLNFIFFNKKKIVEKKLYMGNPQRKLNNDKI